MNLHVYKVFVRDAGLTASVACEVMAGFQNPSDATAFVKAKRAELRKDVTLLIVSGTIEHATLGETLR